MRFLKFFCLEYVRNGGKILIFDLVYDIDCSYLFEVILVIKFKKFFNNVLEKLFDDKNFEIMFNHF